MLPILVPFYQCEIIKQGQSNFSSAKHVRALERIIRERILSIFHLFSLNSNLSSFRVHRQTEKPLLHNI